MTNPDCQTKRAFRLPSGIELEPLIVQLLGQRGVISQKDVAQFLEPKLSELPSPFLMKGMKRAVKIIENALVCKKTILIWGDYDVDGTTATSLLLKFFKSIGCEAEYYIPNRLTEGYGITEKSLKRVASEGCHEYGLLITVDNGISAHEAVRTATELGYKTIITDHHTPPQQEVPADAILNPKQIDCSFPSKNLAGVGVAFYLAMGLRSHLVKTGFFSNSKSIPNLKSLLDLVAIGTVADMVPIHGINRILVRAGMETLSKCSNPGITALCRSSNLDPTFIRSEDISFQIAPKINAAGRLGVADRAVALLLSKTKADGQALARELTSNNELRKNITLKELANALLDVKGDRCYKKNSIVVAGGYHVGVAGILASNLVEKYKKPCVVLCKGEGDVYKGSARSIPGVDLYAAIENCKEILIGFGGHKMAAGLSISGNNVCKFKEMFDGSVYEQTKGRVVEEEECFDADIKIEDLFENKILRQLHMLEPFGQGNPQLIFRDTVASINEITQIGKDKSHLRLSFVGSRRKITKGIAFGLGNLAERCQTKEDKHILYTPSLNFFRGKRSWQARVTSITFNNE
jgi:single-stranded-DNA-specific exonuclease